MTNLITIRPGITLAPFLAGDQPNLILYLNDQLILENTQTLSITHLPAGVYILRTGRCSQLFMKER